MFGIACLIDWIRLVERLSLENGFSSLKWLLMCILASYLKRKSEEILLCIRFDMVDIQL